MRILTIADLPELYKNGRVETEHLAPVDLVLACGDLDYAYLQDVSRAFDAPLYFIKGNHDIRAGETETALHDGCFYIHRKVVSFEGLSILGIDGSLWYNGGENQYTEAQMRRMLRHMQWKIRKYKSLDIMVTHAPPRHIHDREDMCHRGFTAFHRFIERCRPKYLLHGHIHDRFSCSTDRATVLGDTTIINSCGYHLFEVNP